ncbi:leucyl aminopeptidase family protein [Alienimonas chondri]|uniref:Probable cytosol aminopeptidase n=1 Tax=Alienimonas chondri TaxID=2681879 RepID=A0ABX1VD31_9PLAN|nr:leucyl aminopeptidase [Alienimonas chondri]NNJ25830.1 putative cytosol aminopeptidase [Alienimonas chondri]
MSASPAGRVPQTLATAEAARDVTADLLLIPVWKRDDAGAELAALDSAAGGVFARLRSRGDLTGKAGECVVLPDLPNVAADRAVCVGLGEPGELSRAVWAKAIRTGVRKATGKADRTVAALLTKEVAEAVGLRNAAEELASAAVIAGAGPGLYKKEPKRFPLQSLTAVLSDTADVQPAEDSLERGAKIGAAVNLARELVDRPAEDIYPESVADRAAAFAADIGLGCEVLGQEELEAERCGSLLAVNRGSSRPPRVVVLSHLKGGDGPTLALVGKGVTFDSGGLSLKPNEGMKDMKCDMAGSAAVLGAMAAIAGLNLPVNVVGYAGLVENMVAGNSYKLGDVLQTRQGTTVEVLNTDAEGRLVLADVLDMAVTGGSWAKPADRIVDLATLTGACVVALGEGVVGGFPGVNSDGTEEWWAEVQAAFEASGEEVWRMPMSDSFKSLLDSEVADVKNVGPRYGGAVTAAKFLEHFVGTVPWVHLDIAGPAFRDKSGADMASGGTGVGVRTLVKLAEAFGK